MGHIIDRPIEQEYRNTHVYTVYSITLDLGLFGSNSLSSGVIFNLLGYHHALRGKSTIKHGMGRMATWQASIRPKKLFSRPFSSRATSLIFLAARSGGVAHSQLPIC